MTDTPLLDGSIPARRRVRELGIIPGILPTGPLNAITDVAGVLVGHMTLIEGDDIRTGATAVLPHAGNPFQEKVPAGVAVGNGYGKLAGSTQVVEEGEIETPIVLTNTLCVARGMEAVLDWTLAQAGNEGVTSVNAVVGETNDALLNNIRRRALTANHIRTAIEGASGGAVAEGCAGAGTGTVAFGWKGGIGTSSRRLPEKLGGYTVGALVQANFGGVLSIAGLPVGQSLGQHYLRKDLETKAADGSILMVLATDAPLSDRNLARLARRAMTGLARTGSAMTDGSGDYAIAFSTAEAVRRTPERRAGVSPIPNLPNALVSPLFLAAVEAVEEAIYNALCTAETMTGTQGRTVQALPLDAVARLAAQRGES